MLVFWIYKVIQGFFFVKFDGVLSMRRNAVMEGFWIFQEWNMSGFHIWKR